VTYLVVRPSPIAGFGAFATRAFSTGDTVHLIDDSRVVDDAHPLRPELGEWPHHQDYLADGRVVLMPSPERYINSSCDPNCWVHTRDGVRHVLALRPIREGDEVTCDYLINCHGGDRWRCACGARNCRGLMPASFFDLPLSEQRRLSPLLDSWFVTEHAGRMPREVDGR
jgi:hypothetical protein